MSRRLLTAASAALLFCFAMPASASDEGLSCEAGVVSVSCTGLPQGAGPVGTSRPCPVSVDGSTGGLDADCRTLVSYDGCTIRVNPSNHDVYTDCSPVDPPPL